MLRFRGLQSRVPSARRKRSYGRRRSATGRRVPNHSHLPGWTRCITPTAMFAGCRCPRDPERTLRASKVDGRDVLSCKRCGGVFVDAALGLRLLAVLEPDVPEHDEERPHPQCPVCRTAMKRAVPRIGGIEVDVCHRHGVWLDGSDLSVVAHAAAAKLGRPVPAAVQALDAHDGRGATSPAQSQPQSQSQSQSPSTGDDWTSLRTHAPKTGSTPATRSTPSAPSPDTIGGRIVHTSLDVIDTAVMAVAIPLELTLEVVGALGDLMD